MISLYNTATCVLGLRILMVLVLFFKYTSVGAVSSHAQTECALRRDSNATAKTTVMMARTKKKDVVCIKHRY